MIFVTGQAVSSIARRNIILTCVPKAVWNRAYQECERIIKGDVQTLSERRGKAIAAFGTWGVKPEQVFAALGVAGEDEVILEHIPTLRGMFSAIKNNEATVEELFSGRPAAGADFQKVANPLADAPPVTKATDTALAEKVVAADGTVTKDRDGEVPAPKPQSAPPAGDAPDAAALEAAVATARQRGADAAQKGKLRAQSQPTQYRGDDGLTDAYFEAFDTKKAELAGGADE